MYVPIESGVPNILIRIIKMYISEYCNKAHVGEHLSDALLREGGPKEGGALPCLLLNFTLNKQVTVVAVYDQGLSPGPIPFQD
jgi:hypothetical protein